jgi:transposase
MDRLAYDQLLKENFHLRLENSQLHQEHVHLRKETSKLLALVKKLEDKIDDLQSKLGKNSKNSSKSPSSDQKPNLPVVQKKEHRPYHPGSIHQLLPEDHVTSRETSTRQAMSSL